MFHSQWTISIFANSFSLPKCKCLNRKCHSHTLAFISTCKHLSCWFFKLSLNIWFLVISTCAIKRLFLSFKYSIRFFIRTEFPFSKIFHSVFHTKCEGNYLRAPQQKIHWRLKRSHTAFCFAEPTRALLSGA